MCHLGTPTPPYVWHAWHALPSVTRTGAHTRVQIHSTREPAATHNHRVCGTVADPRAATRPRHPLNVRPLAVHPLVQWTLHARAQRPAEPARAWTGSCPPKAGTWRPGSLLVHSWCIPGSFGHRSTLLIRPPIDMPSVSVSTRRCHVGAMWGPAPSGERVPLSPACRRIRAPRPPRPPTGTRPHTHPHTHSLPRQPCPSGRTTAPRPTPVRPSVASL